MNRPEFVERTIAYYESLNSPHPLYIGDASNSAIAVRLSAYIARCRNVKVRYFHWECLGANQTIVKLAEMAQAECEYCAFQGDDDYFVPASLRRCAEFLSENPDYRTAQGRGALFTLDRPGPYGQMQGIGDYWGINSLEQDAAVDRLVAFEKSYFVLQFSTHRIKEFVQDSQTYLELKDDLIGELLHCFTFAVKGKSKFIDCLYLVRNSHVGAVHPAFAEWVAKEHWALDYRKAISGLGSALHESSDLSLMDAERVVSEVMDLHIKRQAERETQIMPESLPANFVLFLKAALPLGIRQQLRGVLSGSHHLSLMCSKRSVFHNEFSPILLSVAREKRREDVKDRSDNASVAG